jgi:hypothetical protein
MVLKGERRLIVNINHIREYNIEYAEGYESGSFSLELTSAVGANNSFFYSIYLPHVDI